METTGACSGAHPVSIVAQTKLVVVVTAPDPNCAVAFQGQGVIQPGRNHGLGVAAARKARFGLEKIIRAAVQGVFHAVAVGIRGKGGAWGDNKNGRQEKDQKKGEKNRTKADG